MAEFRELIAQVMDLAKGYSPRTNAAMRQRKAVLKEMASRAQNWLRDWQSDLVGELNFKAEDGGQVGNVSPVAWMRVYSKTKSPSATAGFYVVYLFESLGTKVFLSVNQGTSEYRTGQWRAITDHTKISDKTAAARLLLEQNGLDMSWGSTNQIDLAVQSLMDNGLFVSLYPVNRVINYEFGNILAKAYARDSIPPDDQLKQDLFAALDCLVPLYDLTPRVTTRLGGLRRLTVAERRAVEQRSMTVTTQHYEVDGWLVKDVSSYRPYDLECKKDRQELHVEVKGTTNDEFQQIELTRNEVDHCRNYPSMALALVSGIQLMKSTSGDPVGAGGKLYLVVPWTIKDSLLKPLTYIYRLADGN